jgi:UDP-glucose 4-epimerase
MRLLVTGGAGYIGSVVAALLLGRGHEVTVLDSLERGHRAAIPAGATFVQADLRDAAAVSAKVHGGYDAVMHFAALALVAESVEHPERYWTANVGGTRNLLDALRAAGVPRLVFSSTCATYGTPDHVPMDESTPTRPESPYGTSKLAVDLMIGDETRAHGLDAVSLRYFNVAGASGGLGEDHDPETHLIPNVLRTALGQREAVEVFGTDYPTRDGTAMRDYIHVEDLAEAHVLALEGGAPGRHRIFNLGSGDGYTVREVIETARNVTGVDIPARETDRRPGDPTALIASSDKICDELGWEPHKDLEAMIEDAWTWHQAHPAGYADLEGGASPS